MKRRNKAPYTAAKEDQLKAVVKRRWPNYSLEVEGSRPYKKGTRLILTKDPDTEKPVRRILKHWPSNREALLELQNPKFDPFASSYQIAPLFPNFGAVTEKVLQASQIRKALNLYTEASKIYESLFGTPLSPNPVDRLKRALSSVKKKTLKDIIVGGSSK